MYMCPLKTKISGPAGIQKDGDDIIDETFNENHKKVLAYNRRKHEALGDLQFSWVKK